MLGRLEWCGKSERSRIALFLKPIQPSRPVDACGFRPIICMSTIKHCDLPVAARIIGVQKSGSASSDARNRRGLGQTEVAVSGGLVSWRNSMRSEERRVGKEWRV